MVVKKSIRRSKNNKNKKQQQQAVKDITAVTTEQSKFETVILQPTKTEDYIVNKSSMSTAVDKLKATLEKLEDVPNPSQRISRLPEGFHQSRVLAVSSIRCLHVFYDGAPDTFALSVGILDKFLATIKVKQQHLSCVAAACYFISTKIHEEEENLPSGNGLCKLHGNRWKLSDLCRMESVILQKLGWTLPLTTYLTFINHFLEILQDNYPGVGVLCSVEKMVDIAEKYLRFGFSLFFKPSSVALCILYQYLQDNDLLDSTMSAFIFKLQSICAITDSEMFECQQVVKQAEISIPEPIPKSQRISNSLFFKIRSRPSYDGETDLPTIEEDNTQED